MGAATVPPVSSARGGKRVKGLPPKAPTRLRKRLEAALSRICLIGQRGELIKECGRLADEQAHVSQEIDDSPGNSLWIRRANHGATRKFCANEFAGNGKDQVGL